MWALLKVHASVELPMGLAEPWVCPPPFQPVPLLGTAFLSAPLTGRSQGLLIKPLPQLEAVSRCTPACWLRCEGVLAV